MANTYLSKTLGTATNRKKFTISLWFKKSSNSGHQYFLGTGVDGNNNDNFSIHSTIQSLKIGGYESGTTYELKTNASLRDNSAWYNAVVSFDSTQSTDTNRLKMYINGEQVTSFATAVYPSLNYEPLINKNTAHNIGAAYNASGFFDGSISHFHFIDGTAYDASAFGETDATTGIWKPKTAPSVTYGTNGFFLKFENSGAFGTDSSGNSNTFTVNGTMTQNIDTPSNVFATFNPLGVSRGQIYGNGNTNTTTVPNAAQIGGFSTLGMSSGKYYAEFELDSFNTNRSQIGVADNPVELDRANTVLGESTYSVSYLGNGGNIVNNSSAVGSGSSYTTGDIIGVALNLDDNNILFYKNGVVQNSGTAVSITPASSTPTGFYFFTVGDSSASYKSQHKANFGNGYFGTTAVSSAQNPDDGIGIFEHNVPAGYKALCTKSINAQEYD